MTKTIQPPVIDGIFKLFEIVMVICITLMLVMVFGNVILRIFFNTGIDLSEELPRFAFVRQKSLLGHQPVHHGRLLYLHLLWDLAAARDP